MSTFMLKMVEFAFYFAIFIGLLDLAVILIQDMMPSRKTTFSLLAVLLGFLGFRYWKKNNDSINDGENIKNDINPKNN